MANLKGGTRRSDILQLDGVCSRWCEIGFHAPVDLVTRHVAIHLHPTQLHSVARLGYVYNRFIQGIPEQRKVRQMIQCYCHVIADCVERTAIAGHDTNPGGTVHPLRMLPDITGGSAAS